MNNINWKSLIINISIPLFLIGGLSSYLTRNSMQVYSELNTPKLSPPSWIFSIVWPILYILMGIASYIVYEADSIYKSKALTIYASQLILNFIWSIVFFNLEKYWLSVAIIIVLNILIFLTIIYFYIVDKKAAFLLIPYMLWVLFATYLNVSIALLN